MKTRSAVQILFGAALSAALAACGPTVRNAPELESTKLQTVAVLPPLVESDIRRERVEYLHQNLIRQLETNGYIALDQAIVNKICGTDAACPGRKDFGEKYGVDALVELKITSQARVNFVAGYYNTISGEVRLLTPDSKELVSVDHQESERGGLVFNSGQVIQGLIQTFENTGDDSFNKLAERFTKTVALRLPAPSGGAKLAKVTDVNITRTNIKPLGDSRFEVCVEGNPRATAEFVVDRVRTPLREIKSGEYCGALLLSGLVQPTSRVSAELRSPFGVPAQQSIDAAPFLSCAPKNLVSRSISGGSPRLAFGCNDGLAAADKEKCESQLANCTGSQFLIFRADSSVGPFEKVGQAAPPGWVDKKAKSTDKSVYAVVAVTKNNGASVPVTVTEQ